MNNELKNANDMHEIKRKDLSDLVSRLSDEREREVKSIQAKINIAKDEETMYTTQIGNQKRLEAEAEKIKESMQLDNGDLRNKVEKIDDEISKIREEPGRLEYTLA